MAAFVLAYLEEKALFFTQCFNVQQSVMKGAVMKMFFKVCSIGAGVMLVASGALAQTTKVPISTASASMSGASAPTTIGVTPQEAKEATRKAVPRTDTGTLVRTKPSPATKAKELASDQKTGSAAKQHKAASRSDAGKANARSANPAKSAASAAN